MALQIVYGAHTGEGGWSPWTFLSTVSVIPHDFCLRPHTWQTGDGECSDDILAAHNSSSPYEKNGACVSGIPEGFMVSHSLLLVGLVGTIFPLLVLEASPAG